MGHPAYIILCTLMTACDVVRKERQMTVLTAQALLPFAPVKRNGRFVLNYLPKSLYQSAKSLKSIFAQ